MKTLYRQNWYRPMEIAKLGLIKNSNGDKGTVLGHYNFILEQIKSGQLRAKDYSKATRPFWLVSEAEINRFNNGPVGPEDA